MSDEAQQSIIRCRGSAWHADALNSTLPWLQRTHSGSIIALPWSDFVDNRVLRASPRDYYDAYIEMFEYLYTQERLGLINIAIHGHFGGRPMMSAIFANVLRPSERLFRRVVRDARQDSRLVRNVERIPAEQRFRA